MLADNSSFVTSMWLFLPLGYALTILMETPILLFGLSPRHSIKRRLLCGMWLTACTYPIVVIVLPIAIWQPYDRGLYLIVAETFAPLAECLLFWAVCRPVHNDEGSEENLETTATRRDYAVIILANLTSFLTGEFVLHDFLD
jgi:hypothetical protein